MRTKKLEKKDIKEVKIRILKNGVPVREFICNEKNFQIAFYKVQMIAGGMWNGVDEITMDSARIEQ